MVLLVNLLILSYHVILVNLAILLLVIFGDLGNTNGSEESDDSDYFCTMGDFGIFVESGAFSDYTQSHRSGDFGSSGVGCEEYRFSIRTNIQTKKQYEQMSEYICIKKMIRTNIQIYSYQENVTFKYSNIFI